MTSFVILSISVCDELLPAETARELFLAGVRSHMLEKTRFMLESFITPLKDAFKLIMFIMRLVDRVSHVSFIHYFNRHCAFKELKLQIRLV